MLCHKCGNQNPDNASFCSRCGAVFSEGQASPPLQSSPNNPVPSQGFPPSSVGPVKKGKKPLYKRWWVYPVGLLIIIIIGSALSSGSDSPSATPAQSPNGQSTASQSPESSPEQTPEQTPDAQPTDADTSDNDIDSQKRDLVQLYALMGQSEFLPYTLSPKAEAFLQENPELFPFSGEEADLLKHTDFEIESKHIFKNSEKHGDKLMFFEHLYVKQIFETEVDSTLTMTELNLVDASGNQYYAYYLDELDDIFEEDEIKVYGLPLSSSGFENTDGGTTLVVVLGGCYVEKYED